MQVLWPLFEFVRDLAIMAAGIGIAHWAWTQHGRTPQRDNAEARSAIDAERRANDLRQWAERMDARADAMAGRLDEIAAQAQTHAQTEAQASEQRAVLEGRIHRLLQATTDPFLNFGEVRDGLARTEPSNKPRETDEAIRRALIALISNRAVAQLDRDRYFIASDFEAEESDAADPK